MSFVDAIHNSKKNIIQVAERGDDGQRHLVDFDAEYVFYYSHPAGRYTSLYGDPVKRFVTHDGMKFRRELGRYTNEVDRNGQPKYKIFEADINPVFRAFETHYKGVKAPKLNVCFFDIETGFDADRGFAPVTDPFNDVTAISLWLSQTDQLITLALLPPTLTTAEGEKITQQFENTILFENDIDLLRAFLAIVEDSDVLSGWNSTLFDIPYIINRIKRRIDDDTCRELCLWNQMPRQRIVMKFGKEHESYDLFGRVHLDYLELYQKHNPKQQLSYRLDYIGEVEVGDNKIPYEGTLDDLYKKDFFKFIEYSRQDVALLVKIDKKKRFIELANQIAHVNCVQLKTTMGSVALVEQAIILEMHDMDMVAPNRRPRPEDEEEEDIQLVEIVTDDDEEDEEEYDPSKPPKKKPVVGAYVAKPKTGLHENMGSIDINSLYPSAIRALNISPETVVGQVRLDLTTALIDQRIAAGTKPAEAWDGVFAALEVDEMHKKSDVMLTVDLEDGTSKAMTGAQLHTYIFAPGSNRCITANGTIFRTDKDGIIPLLLGKWYAERKVLQAKEAAYRDVARGITIPPELAERIAALL